jgi:magnesium transporter
VDLAQAFERLDRERWPALLERLDPPQTAGLLAKLPDHLRGRVARRLGQRGLALALRQMASDDAADVLADLPPALAQLLLRELPAKRRQHLQSLLQHPEDTAGGLMQVELVSIPEDATVAQAVAAIRAATAQVGPLHFVYVVDREGCLTGVVKLDRLVLSDLGQLVGDLMEPETLAVTPEMDQEHVARIFARYDLLSLAVVDEEGRLLGRILHDDVVDVLVQEAEEDLLQMAGARRDGPDLVYSRRLLKIASMRLPWLLTTMVGLTVSATLYWRFQTHFPGMLALIPFIPVISAMGGNVGTQSAIIVVRGIATGRASRHSLARLWLRELAISLMMGVACGLVTGLVAVVWQGDLRLAITVSAAMTLAIAAAASMGLLVPHLFRVLRVDPAIAAGPVVTTLEDITSILIYYGLARLVIGG